MNKRRILVAANLTNGGDAALDRGLEIDGRPGPSCISFTRFPRINGSLLVRPKDFGELPNSGTVRSEWA